MVHRVRSPPANGKGASLVAINSSVSPGGPNPSSSAPTPPMRRSSAVYSAHQPSSPSPLRAVSLPPDSPRASTPTFPQKQGQQVPQITSEPPPCHNPGIVLAIVSAPVLLTLVFTAAVAVCIQNNHYYSEPKEVSSNKPATREAPLASRRHASDADSGLGNDAEPQDLEAPGLSSESKVATAVQVRVYKPGSASIVNVRGGGARRPSSLVGSSRSVVDVCALPDLCGAEALVTRSGSRASTGPSRKTTGENKAAKVEAGAGDEGEKREKKRPRKLRKKRAVVEEQLRRGSKLFK